MGHTVKEIAAGIRAQAVGEIGRRVRRLSEPELATEDDLAVALSPLYMTRLGKGRAQVALLREGADWQHLGLAAAILVPEPRRGLAQITGFWDQHELSAGVHPSAIIDPEAEIGDGVSIGPLCVIGPRARIGAGSVIGAQCFVGRDSVVGDHARLAEAVRIGTGVTIGARFRAHQGAVIGSDGFSFTTARPGPVDALRRGEHSPPDIATQPWERVHSLGGVIIGDDVELGANSTIDSGTLRPTRIGTGTKIDNLVMVGHNVEIGSHCLLCGQTGLAGSVRLGDQVILGGQTGVKDHVRIGDHVITGAGTLVLSHVAAGQILLGNPAQPLNRQLAFIRHIRRLSRQLIPVKSRKKTVFKPESTE